MYGGIGFMHSRDSQSWCIQVQIPQYNPKGLGKGKHERNDTGEKEMNMCNRQEAMGTKDGHNC